MPLLVTVAVRTTGRPWTGEVAEAVTVTVEAIVPDGRLVAGEVLAL
jgi:hypothetical protein